MPICPFHWWFSLLKLNSRKKGTFIIRGLLGNLENLFVQKLSLLKSCLPQVYHEPEYDATRSMRGFLLREGTGTPGTQISRL